MSGNWKVGLGMLAVALMVAVVLLVSHPWSAVSGADPKDGGPSKHTVVSTDGTHLVVTDNQADKVYFYAIDRDGKPGDELKLRGSLDLADVGKPSLKPTAPPK